MNQILAAVIRTVPRPATAAISVVDAADFDSSTDNDVIGLQCFLDKLCIPLTRALPTVFDARAWRFSFNIPAQVLVFEDRLYFLSQPLVILGIEEETIPFISYHFRKSADSRSDYYATDGHCLQTNNRCSFCPAVVQNARWDYGHVAS